MKGITIFINILLIILLCSNLLNAQRLLKISVALDSETKHLSFVERKSITYVSSKELAVILGGNFYFNPEAVKVEMKFSDYNLKVTARNQFIVLVSRIDNTHQIFQLPISTLFIHNDVFIPLTYTLKYIALAYQKELIFDEKEKHLTVTGKPNSIGVDLISEKEEEMPAEPVIKPPGESIKSPYDIYELSLNELTNGTLIRLKTTKPIHRFSSSIQEGKLRLFISSVTVAPDLLSRFNPTGFVKKAEIKNVKGNKQIEFLLNDGYSTHESTKDVDSDDIIVTIHNKVFSTFEESISRAVSEWNFDAVVIDAGHGGKDPGAIGTNSVREKVINLKIALKLGGMIKEQMPDVNVIYTRDDDTFVELYKRGKIANENNGKLFISIHCNSMGKKKSGTRGFEVYLLRPGKTQQAIEIAEFENSVISYEDNPDRYQKLTDENFILVTMAHSAYMRYSEKFSDLLNRNWSNVVTGIPSRGVKQAGFYVLVGASMPGVLIETGFLSNSKDEEYLNSERGQKDIANAILKSIKEYRGYYTEQLEKER